MEDEFLPGYALLIGTASEKSIEATANDAQELAKIIRKQLLFSPNNVREQFRHTADKKGLTEGFEWLAKESDGDSFVIIYYGGHGAPPNATCNEFHLRPYKFNEGDKSTLLTRTEFQGLLNKVKARKMVLFLNSCYAGGVVDLAGDKVAAANEGYDRLFKDLDSGNGRAIVYATGSDQRSYVKIGAMYTMFGQRLIEALKGEASQGKKNVTLQDVISHLNLVQGDANEFGVEQTIRTTQKIEGNFIVAPGPKSAPNPRPETLKPDDVDTRRTVKNRIRENKLNLQVAVEMIREGDNLSARKMAIKMRTEILADLNEYEGILELGYRTSLMMELHTLDRDGREDFWIL